MTATGDEDRGWRLRHLPLLLTVSGVLIVAAALLGGVLRDGAGAVGAALGVGIVTASYLISTLLIAWADAVRPALVLPVGMTAYAVKFTVIGVVMAAVAASGWDGLVPLGLGVVAGVVAWTATQIIWVVRNPPRLAYRPPAEARDD
ncbi:MAG TPA: hypothetical protein VGJ63_22960 [Micromonosporaceae bacterium]|jgi:hypothetical protein